MLADRAGPDASRKLPDPSHRPVTRPFIPALHPGPATRRPRDTRPVQAPVDGRCAPGSRRSGRPSRRTSPSGARSARRCTCVVRGEVVVDLVGGWTDEQRTRPLAARHARRRVLGREGDPRAARAAARRRGTARARPADRRRLARVRGRGQGAGDRRPRAEPPGRRSRDPRAAHRRRPVRLGADDGRASPRPRRGGCRASGSRTTPTRSATSSASWSTGRAGRCRATRLRARRRAARRRRVVRRAGRRAAPLRRRRVGAAAAAAGARLLRRARGRRPHERAGPLQPAGLLVGRAW